MSSGLPEKLTDARIELLDKKGNLNYSFQNAEVSIISGDDYLAKADFVFTNRDGDEQTVTFETLAVNEGGKTFGETLIEETQDFRIDPNMQYVGEVSLNPEENQRMLLTGEVKFSDPCIQESSDWYMYQDSLVDDLITIQNYGDKKQVEPHASFVFNSADQKFKVLMANNTDNPSDVALLNLKGKFRIRRLSSEVYNRL